MIYITTYNTCFGPRSLHIKNGQNKASYRLFRDMEYFPYWCVNGFDVRLKNICEDENSRRVKVFVGPNSWFVLVAIRDLGSYVGYQIFDPENQLLLDISTIVQKGFPHHIYIATKDDSIQVNYFGVKVSHDANIPYGVAVALFMDVYQH